MGRHEGHHMFGAGCGVGLTLNELGLPASPPPPPPPPAALPDSFAAYRFDGDHTDSSGNGRHLIPTVTQDYVAGLLGQATVVGNDASPAAPFAGTAGQGSTGLAISLWLYAAGGVGQKSVNAWLDYNGGGFGTDQFELYADVYDWAPGEVELYVEGICSGGSDSSSVDLTGLPANQWYHLGWTVTPAGYALYVNGVAQAAGVPSDPILADGTEFNITVRYVGGGLSAPLDMLLFFADPVDAAGMLALYNAGVGFDPTA